MHFSNPCSRAKGFVLSPLPELGTMGSKWGGARVTDSSTSSRICSVPVLMHLKRAGADLLNVLMLMQHPSARMPLKAEMGIVVRCRRSRKQDQLALGAQALFRETNKLLPYTIRV